MATDEMDRSDQILSAAKQRKEKEQSIHQETETVEMVIFTLDDDHYAFYGSDVKELIPYETITFVPGCPDFIDGIINVRGDIESVLNLRRIMGLPAAAPPRNARIIIADREGIRSGILVDAVVDVVSVEADRIRRPIATLGKSIREYAVGGETLYGEHYVTVLDVGKIFSKVAE